MTAGQDYVRDWELAIAARLMTASDTGMLAYADQARAVFVTQRTLVVIKVRVTLEKVRKCTVGVKKSSLL